MAQFEKIQSNQSYVDFASVNDLGKPLKADKKQKIEAVLNIKPSQHEQLKNLRLTNGNYLHLDEPKAGESKTMKEQSMKYVPMENFKIVEILNKDKYHAIFDYREYMKKVDMKAA